MPPSSQSFPIGSDEFIAARVEEILAARRRKHPEAAMGTTWWIGAVIMLGLGLVDGLGWWIVQMTTHGTFFQHLLP